jgi:hypothetical protein
LDFLNFSSRDAIIFAVIAIVAYLLVSLLRLSQIRRRRKTADPSVTQAANLSPIDDLAATPPVAASFEDRLFRTNIEAELQALRQEVAELREALEQIKASRRVSPQYNEAMLLAQRGVDASIIADRCAIAIGEAELVVALSRNRQEYEDYDAQYEERH